MFMPKINQSRIHPLWALVLLILIAFLAVCLVYYILVIKIKPQVAGDYNIAAVSECSDGVDNDSDGLVDYQYDLGCAGPSDEEQAQDRSQENGWTTYDPDASSRLIYVSSSGNDNNNGLTPQTPKKTVAAGKALLRNGYPDWLLFKRGDTWTNEILGSFNTLRGPSAIKPMVIASYGESLQRPRFVVYGASGSWFSTIKYTENISLIGLAVKAAGKDPSDPLFNGQGMNAIAWTDSPGNFLLEDNKFEFMQINLQGNATKDFTLRRNVIVDNYSLNSHAQGLFTSIAAPLLIEENIFDHNGWNDDFRFVLLAPQSDYLKWQTITSGRFGLMLSGAVYNIDRVNFSGVSSMAGVADVLEQAINQAVGQANAVDVSWTNAKVLKIASSVFKSDDQYKIMAYSGSTVGTNLDSSTWLNASAVGVPESTIFNRNMYLAYGYGHTTLRGNIDANGASGGTQLRMGGVAEDNLFLRNPISLVFGHSQNPGGTTVSGSIKNNVVLGARDIDTQVQGTGIIVESQASVETNTGASLIDGLEVSGNIIAHLGDQATGNIKGLSLGGSGVLKNVNVTDNIVYNWTRPVWPNNNDTRSYALALTGGSHLNYVIANNFFQQPKLGGAASGNNLSAGVPALSNNHYYSVSPNPGNLSAWFFQDGSSLSSESWLALTQETNPDLAPASFADPSRTIETYMSSLGETPTLEAFMAKTRLQSKYAWDNRFSTSVVNNYIRAGFSTGKTICTPNWSCTAWSVCSSSLQTRTCTDTNNCGTISGKPSESQSCTITNTNLNTNTNTNTNLNTNTPLCTPNWSCTAWSTCTSSRTQTRTCTDLSKCGTTSGKPSEKQSCSTKTSRKPGSLIKLSYDSAVYVIDDSNQKRLYANSPTFWSYYTGTWNNLKLDNTAMTVAVVTQTEFDDIPISKNVTVKSGSRLLKFANSPKIYSIFDGVKLKVMTNQTLLSLCYGAQWRDKVITIQGGFETDYVKTETGFVDSDNDCLSDNDEINGYQSNPAKADTDGDGFNDGLEIIYDYSYR